MRPRPPAIKTDGKIASPSRPSVRLTALDEPMITKMLINRKIKGEITKIYSLLKGKIKICSFPLGETCNINNIESKAKRNCKMSLYFPFKPFEFFSFIFNQSSKNPIELNETVINIRIHMYGLLKSDQSNVEIINEKIIIKPPMVGVPVFARCDSGPSPLMDCEN